MEDIRVNTQPYVETQQSEANDLIGREITFLNKFSVKKTGTVGRERFCVFDITNDGENNLIFGSLHGRLRIFRQNKCLYKCDNLGTIMCLCCGWIDGIPILFVVNCEGELHAFNFTEEAAKLGGEEWSGHSLPKTFNEDNSEPAGYSSPRSKKVLMKRSMSLKTLRGLKDDEEYEDEFLETKRVEDGEIIVSGSFSLPINTSLSNGGSAQKGNEKQLLVKPFVTFRVSLNCKCCLVMDIDGDGNKEIILGHSSRLINVYKFSVNKKEMEASELLHLEQWKFENKVYCLREHLGKFLLVGFFSKGGAVIVKKPDSRSKMFSGMKHLRSRNGFYLVKKYKEKLDVPCMFEGNIGFLKEDSKQYVCFCMLSGRVSLFEVGKRDNRNPDWFFDFRVDILGVGSGFFSKGRKVELCVTTTHGKTYIFNDKKEFVFLNLRKNIQGFKSGIYSLMKNHKSLCLFYSTVEQKLVFFEGINIQSIKLKSLNDIIKPGEIKPYVKNEKDKIEAKRLINSLLYCCTEYDLEKNINKFVKEINQI